MVGIRRRANLSEKMFEIVLSLVSKVLEGKKN
jgi:hypothetical protein